VRIIALEEHVSFRCFASEIDPALKLRRGMIPSLGPESRTNDLDEVDEKRLRLMDEAGIDVQVLSVITRRRIRKRRYRAPQCRADVEAPGRGQGLLTRQTRAG
jgi:hypothetical protein